MTESDYEEIKEHLNKLENQNRLIKQAGILLAIIMFVVFMILCGRHSDNTPRVFKELKAEKIMVVDSNGKTQIGMTITDSRPVFYIKDSNEKTGLLMSTNDGEIQGGYISILNKTNHEAIKISPDKNGNGVVSIYNREGIVNEIKSNNKIVK